MQTEPTHTDQRYAELFASGDQQALAWFYKNLYPALSLFAFHYVKDRHAAEEIAADGFIKTWQQHNKLNTAGAIRAYLYTVVRNDCIRFIKKENRKNKSLKELPATQFTDQTAFDRMVTAEISRNLHNALQELAPGASTVLKLHFLEGKTLQEIAQELGLSPSTVKTQKQRGLKALFKKMLRPLFSFLISL